LYIYIYKNEELNRNKLHPGTHNNNIKKHGEGEGEGEGWGRGTVAWKVIEYP